MFVSCPQWMLTQRVQILLCCWVSESGTVGKRPGSVSGYEDHMSCNQPQDGFVRLGAIKPGPKVLFQGAAITDLDGGKDTISKTLPGRGGD